MKGQIASPEELKARWAYSELSSLRFQALYAGVGPQQLHDMAFKGDPFSAVPEADWPELVKMLNAARCRDFAGNIDPSPSYVCAGWNKSQLMSILALPAFNPPLKQKPIPYSQFYNGTPNTGPGMTPEPSDPRCAIASINIPPTYVQTEPVIVIAVQGRLILLEGYLRSLLFMKSPDSMAELLVWVPQGLNNAQSPPTP